MHDTAEEGNQKIIDCFSIFYNYAKIWHSCVLILQRFTSKKFR